MLRVNTLRWAWWLIGGPICFGGQPELSAPCPGADLFRAGAVWGIHIKMDAADLESLRKDSREFVSSSVTEGTNAYTEVAVHLKGSVGSFRPLDDKPGLTLDFSRFNTRQRFHGLRRIHLNNSVEDPSYANEAIGSELFRAAGVPAPRVSRARASLNGRDLGFYVLKEGFTEDFLSCYFKQVGGDLYEPGTGHDVDQRLKRNSVEAPSGNRSALKALAAAVAEPNESKRWARLEQVLDTRRFLAFMAMEIMLCHRDGYCLARNNYRVYHDVETGKVVFFPHGMDQLLGDPQWPWQPAMSGLVAKAVMETKQGKEQYESCFRSLFTNVFRSELIASRVDQLVEELRPFARGTEFPAILKEGDVLRREVIERERNLRRQLSQPGLQPLRFEGGAALLPRWAVLDAPVKGKMEQGPAPDGVAALRIEANGETLASWAARALLAPGRYRLEGRARVAGVIPLGYGIHQGAGLRVGGSVRHTPNLTGNSDWRALTADFQVEGADKEIEFICELRANSGVAWFDLDSLRVVRVE